MTSLLHPSLTKSTILRVNLISDVPKCLLVLSDCRSNATGKCINLCWLTTTFVPSDLLYCHYTEVILCQFAPYRFQWTYPTGTPNLPCPKSHIHFPLPRSFQRIRSISKVFVTFGNKLFFLWRGVVSPSTNHRGGGPPLVESPLLIVQYIRSYTTYVEAVSSIRNTMTRYAVVTGTHIVLFNQGCAKVVWISTENIFQ
jgi:hypothetical protein